MKHLERIANILVYWRHRRLFGAGGSQPALAVQCAACLSSCHGGCVEGRARPDESRCGQNHILLAYSLLLEKHCGLPCPLAFVILKDRGEMAAMELDQALRQQTLETARRARQVVVEQMMPPATEVRARCVQCEYRNFCGDVF